MSVKELLKKYQDPKNFFNRELSWIEFNRRVLEEALNPDLPLLEKVKFISIFSSNMDEFYMIRLSGLKEQISANFSELSIDGLTPIDQLARAERAITQMLQQISELWLKEIVPGLAEKGVAICPLEDLSAEELQPLREYFAKEIFPVLTPLAFDPGRPFPYISNLSLSLAVVVQNPKGEKHFARVKVPSILPRLVRVDTILCPGKTGNGSFKAKFIWLGDLIKDNLQMLFPRMEILEAHRFRITRDTDIEIQEDEADDLLKVIEYQIRQRKFGNVVRLEIERSMPEHMVETLIENLEITRKDVQIIDGPLGLSDVMQLYDLPLPHLKERVFVPVIPRRFEEEEDIFTIIKKKDVLLHHPFDSFVPVVNFVKQASADPDVLAIKQTLYRVGPKSPVVKYLIEAAERGKQVAVLVELKARFDEENNIYWARELEKAGAHVVYGLVGLKTHAKMTLVVRRELDGLKRYVHLATGNYNASTAKLYTDIGMLTRDEDICSDVSEIFNYLTGYSKQNEFKQLLVAPVNLRQKLQELILREAEQARQGLPARIIIKINSLVDPAMICALYEASAAGVKIDLIVRGICCLVPGVPGLSENITVTSIVGRFLEHSRVLYFHNAGEDCIYLSSADMMQRNLDRRVEIAYPVTDKALKEYILETILRIYLKDNTKARILRSDLTYVQAGKPDGEKDINSQEWFMNHAVKVAAKKQKKRL